MYAQMIIIGNKHITIKQIHGDGANMDKGENPIYKHLLWQVLCIKP